MGLRKALILLLALICICFGFAACQAEDPDETTSQTTASEYTVTYRVLGEVYKTQTVAKGTAPEAVTPEIAGMKFYGWRDADGALLASDAVLPEEDTVLEAELFADISSHAPYLFADGNGFLRPQAPLTAGELSIALNVLAASGAEPYLPEIPQGTEALTASDLEKVLEGLFPKEQWKEALSRLEGPGITRGDFAVLMNGLLGRTADGAVAAQGAKLPVDLPVESEALAALCEACFHHTHEEGKEQAWSEVLKTAQKQPQGFFNADGWLYCVNESGLLVRDTQMGKLTFGADGRFTFGDGELDAMVAEILAQILSDNPGAERIDLLRRAFEYSRDSFTYLRRSAYAFGQTGWEIEDAKKMLTTKRGNCYSYAAVFWALARGLGYEAIAISGTMTGTYQPHSWVEIYFDGEPFVFDPEMEMVYRFERDIFDKDMFMVDYIAGEYWTYRRP